MLDVITTWYALTYLGLNEINPVANTLFATYGLITALVCTKAIGVMIIYLCVSVLPENKIKCIYNSNVRKIGITTICLFFVIVVINNIYWILSTF